MPCGGIVLSGLTDVDLDAIANYHAAEGSVASVACVVARTGYTGEDGFELFCDADRARDLWDAVAAAGEPLGLRPCGLGARDTLRLEAGMPLYGNELDRETNPFEVNLGRVVKLEKGEFVGRAALEAVEGGVTAAESSACRWSTTRPSQPIRGPADGRRLGGSRAERCRRPRHQDCDGQGGHRGRRHRNAFEVVVRDRPYRAER